jgi:predicted metal-dependent hydrolase
MKPLNEFLNEAVDNSEKPFYDKKIKVVKSKIAKGLEFIKSGAEKDPITIKYKGKEIGTIIHKDPEWILDIDTKYKTDVRRLGGMANFKRNFQYSRISNLLRAVENAVAGNSFSTGASDLTRDDGSFSDYDM